jgi:hypothetical protein
VAYQNQRANLAGSPFKQYLGDFGRPIQVPGDLGLDALGTKLLGEAIAANAVAVSSEALSKRSLKSSPSGRTFRRGMVILFNQGR